WGLQFEGDDSIFTTGLTAALELFKARGVRATLFVIASSLDDPAKRKLIEEAVRRGHEIASHTITHPNLLQIDSAQKQIEIGDSRARLEQRLQVPVRGFRAPGYRLDRECLELLAAAGYAWDASASPTAAMARRLGAPVDALTAPFRPLEGREFLELPLPDHRPSPVPFSPSYAHLLGTGFYRWGVKRAQRRGGPLIILFHLIDFSDPLPSCQLSGWRSRIASLSMLGGPRKRRSCRRMLDEIATRYRLTSTDDLIREVRSGLPNGSTAQP
ncbi:MAG TPA: polysaccharide deacetylase family protein, partial [Vicinamibacterales bacterium]|nr:polysaccharide deacetylase family protein [Vicinamibacterales bacterium]